MKFLIITFGLNGIDEEAYQRMVEPAVPSIIQAPGMIAKIFLADSASNRYGGAYLFSSRDDIERYLASDLLGTLKADPRIADITTQVFDTLPSLTRLTQGPLPLHPKRAVLA